MRKGGGCPENLQHLHHLQRLENLQHLQWRVVSPQDWVLQCLPPPPLVPAVLSSVFLRTREGRDTQLHKYSSQFTVRTRIRLCARIT